ncbi:MAG: hypothetical protein Q8908_01275 [Bacteroidota bacterium]|nr:hypothetical protein [Bacteroidota bacterium]
MKIVFFVLFVLIFATCSGQSRSKTVKNQNLYPEQLLTVENELYQNTRFENKDTVMPVVNWDEFDEDSNDRVLIPNEVMIKTSFNIDSEWAGEKIPLDNVFFKTTIQFIYGEAVIGDNICNPIHGKEITLLNGSFTGKDIEKILLNKLDYSGIRYQTPRFHLRDYLTKNKIRLFPSQKQKYILGRITIRTYFGSSKDNMNTIYETVKNVMKNPFKD